jgi:hypothetical protein
MNGSCESPAFYGETYPRAKKEHHCCECDGAIKIGERYARCAGKSDGTVFVFAQHVACRNFAAAVNRTWSEQRGGECFIPFGYLANEIHNAAEWAEPDDVIALQAMWRAISARGRNERVAA